MYAALTASVFKKVIAEIMMYFEANKDAFNKINAKKFKDHNSYSIGK